MNKVAKYGVIMQFVILLSIIGMWVVQYYHEGVSNEFLVGALTGAFVGIGGFETLKQLDSDPPVKEFDYTKLMKPKE